jgi:putative membrane protein
MLKFLFNIICGILGLYLAKTFVPGVSFNGPFINLAVIGACLGAANFFIKPILKTITLPIRIITLGLFNLIINMGLVFAAEIIFSRDLEINGLIALFWTTVIIWILNFLFGLLGDKNK